MERVLSPALVARATESERRRAASMAASIRLGATAMALLLALICWRVLAIPIWGVYVLPLLGYTLVAGILFAIRERPGMMTWGWLPSIADVGIMYFIQSRALSASAHPPELAGLSVGVFAVLVALSGLSLRPRLIFLAAASAIVAAGLLLEQANLPAQSVLAATAILLLAAVISHGGIRRMHSLAASLAEAEVARQLEKRRLTETDAAKQTIERMLADARAQNERLQRLQQDKESLVQLIVHDLRSPVNAIMLSVEFIAQDLERRRAASPELKEALGDVTATSNRLTAMITQILDTAKLEEGRLTLDRATVPASELLDGARQHATAIARGKAIDVQVAVAPGLALNADPRLFSRLFENLVSNSIRHTPAVGRILLAAERKQGDIVLSVHNNGAPIDPQERERIFEKFTQGSTRGPRLSGWGLGLYFCRMVVEAHGGRIAVEEIDGWPTSFVIRLPIEDGSAEPAGSDPGQSTETRTTVAGAGEGRATG